MAKIKEADRGTGESGSLPLRQPPPMRVVTKGWWVLHEKEIDIKELEKEDRNERART